MPTVESIELNVVTVFGLSVQIDAPKDLSMRVGELKQKIAESKIGSQAEKQIIYFNNQEIFFKTQTLKGTSRSEFEVENSFVFFSIACRNWCEHERKYTINH